MNPVDGKPGFLRYDRRACRRLGLLRCRRRRRGFGNANTAALRRRRWELDRLRRLVVLRARLALAITVTSFL